MQSRMVVPGAGIMDGDIGVSRGLWLFLLLLLRLLLLLPLFKKLELVFGTSVM